MNTRISSRLAPRGGASRIASGVARLLGGAVLAGVPLLAGPIAAAQVAAVPTPRGVAPLGGAPETLVKASGASLTQLTVRSVALPSGVESAPLLSGIQLLPLDLAGRTTATDLLPGRGRVVAIEGGASAVELPGSGAARVFHYRRTATNDFGMFSVAKGGDLRLLVERKGIGAGNVLDPFEARVAVAPDGATIAITSRGYSQGGPDGYGDTWLARADGAPFAGGAFAVELTGAGVQEVEAGALAFKGAEVWAAMDGALARAPIDGSAPFATVPYPPPTGATKPELVDELLVSADGFTLAFLAGDDEANLDLYVVDAAGTIANLTHAPSALQPPGYLPGKVDGPHLALAEDGAYVLYDREIANGHELYLRATAPGSAEVHLTPDALFEHSIDTMSGVLFGAGRARFFADSGNANADLYQVVPAAPGGPALTNVTKTSGVAQPFFPNLATINVAATMAAGPEQLIVENAGPGQGVDLWRVDAAGQAAVIASGLSVGPSIVEAAKDGASKVLTLTGASQSQLAVYAPQSGQLTPILSLPATIALADVAAADGGGVLGIAADVAPGARFAATLDLATSQIHLIGGGPVPGARDLQFSRKGRLLFVADAGPGQARTFAADAQSGALAPVGAAAGAALWLR